MCYDCLELLYTNREVQYLCILMSGTLVCEVEQSKPRKGAGRKPPFTSSWWLLPFSVFSGLKYASHTTRFELERMHSCKPAQYVFHNQSA